MDAPPADDREVRFCDVDQDQKNMIKDATEGESISVWFGGIRRDAWVAESLKLVSQNLNIGESLSSQQILSTEEDNLEENQNTRTLPWSAEAWQAASKAYMSGTDKPPPRFPIVISQDCFISTAEKLQQLADLPTLPQIETTRTAPRRWEDLDAPPADDREVQICDVDMDQLNRIEDVTEGESISVWFRGTRRDAWVARSSKPSTYRPPPRFPIIICVDSLFSSAEELQQFSELPMLPEIETTRIVPINYDDADGTPADGKEVQICDVDEIEKSRIEYFTEGELINVWFKGATRTAWLARSRKRSQNIDANF